MFRSRVRRRRPGRRPGAGARSAAPRHDRELVQPLVQLGVQPRPPEHRSGLVREACEESGLDRRERSVLPLPDDERPEQLSGLQHRSRPAYPPLVVGRRGGGPAVETGLGSGVGAGRPGGGQPQAPVHDEPHLRPLGTGAVGEHPCHPRGGAPRRRSCRRPSARTSATRRTARAGPGSPRGRQPTPAASAPGRRRGPPRPSRARTGRRPARRCRRSARRCRAPARRRPGRRRRRDLRAPGRPRAAGDEFADAATAVLPWMQSAPCCARAGGANPHHGVGVAARSPAREPADTLGGTALSPIVPDPSEGVLWDLSRPTG